MKSHRMDTDRVSILVNDPDSVLSALFKQYCRLRDENSATNPQSGLWQLLRFLVKEIL